jgi:taurine--2-oxoglutarate transaminase
MAELGGELRSRGYMPFMAANRLHVVPPCIITDAEAKEGLEILEAAFSVMDKHYRG